MMGGFRLQRKLEWTELPVILAEELLRLQVPACIAAHVPFLTSQFE